MSICNRPYSDHPASRQRAILNTIENRLNKHIDINSIEICTDSNVLFINAENIKYLSISDLRRLREDACLESVVLHDEDHKERADL